MYNNMREEEQVHVDMAIPLLNSNGKDTDTTIIWISRNDNDNDSGNGNDSNGECNQRSRSQNKTRFTLILRALVTLSIIGIFAISSFFLCSSHHHDHHNNHDYHHHDHHRQDLHNGELRYSQSEGGGSETIVKSESVLVLAHPLLRGGSLSGSEGGWALTSTSTPTSTSSTLIIMGGYSFTEHVPVSVPDTDPVPDSAFVEEMEHEMEHHNNMIMMKMAMMMSFMATIAREMEVFDSHEGMFAGSLSGFEEPSSPCPYASSSVHIMNMETMPTMPMSMPMPMMTTMPELKPEPESDDLYYYHLSQNFGRVRE